MWRPSDTLIVGSLLLERLKRYGKARSIFTEGCPTPSHIASECLPPAYTLFVLHMQNAVPEDKGREAVRGY